MAINIKTHSYSVLRNTTGGRAAPKYIVLHYTATNGASAQNELLYFATNPAAINASADFFVDGSEIIQYNTKIDSRYSWAVGDGVGSNGKYADKCFNSNQISIEMSCYTDGKGAWHISPATYKNAVELTKWLMQKFNIPADRVIRHYDVSGKHCPGVSGWIPPLGESTWAKFKSAITGKAQTATAPTASTKPTATYRVRKSANDSKSQIGAYNNLNNAKKQADAHAGYKVYDTSGKLIYEPKTGKKSITEIAKEVVAGKWGNGSDRWARLTGAGYNYEEVQAEVNRILRGI